MTVTPVTGVEAKKPGGVSVPTVTAAPAAAGLDALTYQPPVAVAPASVSAAPSDTRTGAVAVPTPAFATSDSPPPARAIVPPDVAIFAPDRSASRKMLPAPSISFASTIEPPLAVPPALRSAMSPLNASVTPVTGVAARKAGGVSAPIVTAAPAAAGLEALTYQPPVAVAPASVSADPSTNSIGAPAAPTPAFATSDRPPPTRSIAPPDATICEPDPSASRNTRPVAPMVFVSTIDPPLAVPPAFWSAISPPEAAVTPVTGVVAKKAGGVSAPTVTAAPVAAGLDVLTYQPLAPPAPASVSAAPSTTRIGALAVPTPELATSEIPPPASAISPPLAAMVAPLPVASRKRFPVAAMVSVSTIEPPLAVPPAFCTATSPAVATVTPVTGAVAKKAAGDTVPTVTAAPAAAALDALTYQPPVAVAPASVSADPSTTRTGALAVPTPAFATSDRLPPESLMAPPDAAICAPVPSASANTLPLASPERSMLFANAIEPPVAVPPAFSIATLPLAATVTPVTGVVAKKAGGATAPIVTAAPAAAGLDALTYQPPVAVAPPSVNAAPSTTSIGVLAVPTPALATSDRLVPASAIVPPLVVIVAPVPSASRNTLPAASMPFASTIAPPVAVPPAFCTPMSPLAATVTPVTGVDAKKAGGVSAPTVTAAPAAAGLDALTYQPPVAVMPATVSADPSATRTGALAVPTPAFATSDRTPPARSIAPPEAAIFAPAPSASR